MKRYNFFSKLTLKKRYLIPALLLVVLSLSTTGTFTWTSVDQRVLNETRHEGAPGGRLHDDFEGLGHISHGHGRVNKDIYVENYSSRNILARVRLSEYLEMGQGAGGDATVNQANPPSGAGLEQATLTDRSCLSSDPTVISRMEQQFPLYVIMSGFILVMIIADQRYLCQLSTETIKIMSPIPQVKD